MKMRFTKMHGLGNDFIVVDLISQHLSDEKLNKLISPSFVQHLADRHFGIGCDQMLLVEPPINPTSDFRYRIFNADGGEVEQCGNGARCFARFVISRGLTQKDNITVDVANGVIELFVHSDKSITVDMAAPIFTPEEIPLNINTAKQNRLAPSSPAPIITINVDDMDYEFVCVSMGNPHAVLIVDDVRNINIEPLAQVIQNHPCFPNSVNVGFMQINGVDNVILRVYERGAGETLACGSGACAAIVAGQSLGLLSDNVNAELNGGRLHIHYALQSGYSTDETVKMTGPAKTSFQGVFYI